jgi:prolyl-tRNA synthetase
VLADSGEDAIAFAPQSDYAANVELAEALAPPGRNPPREDMRRVPTPGNTTCEAVAQLLKLDLKQTVKAVAVVHDAQFHLLLVRGDHTLNEIKTQKRIGAFRFATDAEIQQALHCKAGYIGPVGAEVKVIADRTVAAMSDFVCGANAEGFHLTGVNWGRDLPEPEVRDLRNVVAGDASPDGRGRLQVARGIEVGHIFQLGRKYSSAMNATVLDEAGRSVTLYMGCYGIGITRIVAAAIEQNHDELGIIWPSAIAPFHVVLVPLNLQKSERVRSAAEALYEELGAAGIEVLYDDRDARPGVKFADADLLGVPHRLVLAERGVEGGTVEYKGRRDSEPTDVPRNEIVALLAQRLERGE